MTARIDPYLADVPGEDPDPILPQWQWVRPFDVEQEVQSPIK
jgi:hypothetical protein